MYIIDAEMAFGLGRLERLEVVVEEVGWFSHVYIFTFTWTMARPPENLDNT